MEVWDGCLEENLETEVQSRIIGCRAQMMSLSFTIYSITDNISKRLQAEAVSAVENQKTAKLSLETLAILQSQENSDAFFDMVQSKVENSIH